MRGRSRLGAWVRTGELAASAARGISRYESAAQDDPGRGPKGTLPNGGKDRQAKAADKQNRHL